MVRWIQAQSIDSPISSAITKAAASMYGDPLSGDLKRAKVGQINREEQGIADMSSFMRTMGDNAAANPSTPFIPPKNPGQGRNEFVNSMMPHATKIGGEIGIDPRIIVAQSGLETNWGASAPNNNYFGIKSHGRPNGHVLATNEVVNGQSVSTQSSFRGYPDMASSVADYGAFLRDNPRYGPMLAAPDFDSQLVALGESGYATDPNYGAKVGAIARDIGLEAFTGAPTTGPTYVPPATPSPMNGAPATDGGYNPNNAAQAFAEMAAVGVQAGMSPQAIANLGRFFTANAYGAENQATVNAVVGAGGNYANTYSGFALDQNQRERAGIRTSDDRRYATDSTAEATASRDASASEDRRYATDIASDDRRDATDIASADRRYGTDSTASTALTKDENTVIEVIRDGKPVSILKKNMLPGEHAIISNTENQALTAQGLGMSREEQLAYLNAEPRADATPSAAKWYHVPDGGTVPSTDGQTNATTGEALPNGSAPVSAVGSIDELGLSSTNQSAQEAALISGKQFTGLIQRARDVANAAGPAAFGIIGQARSKGISARQAFETFSQSLGENSPINSEINTTIAELKNRAEAGDPVAKTFFDFDPNLTALEMYARMLPYEAASAIANQTGRGLSDNDVKRFQQIVGDPTSLWGSQKAFITTLNLLETEVAARMGVSRAVINGEQTPTAATSQPANLASTATPDQGASLDFSTMSRLEITGVLASDVELTPEQLDVLEARMFELGRWPQ